MEFSVEWKAICRVCLQQGDIRSIFERDTQNISHAEKIMECSNVHITTEDSDLPQNICIPCLLELDTAFEFRKRCETSDAHLKQSLNDTIKNEPSEIAEGSDVEETQCIVFQEYIGENSELKTEIHENNKNSTDNKIRIKSSKRKSISIKEIKEPKKRGPKIKEKILKICELCGNSFKQRHELETHMRRHRNEKPFACEICGKGFVLNEKLLIHMRMHTGEKPYECKYCWRRFSEYGTTQRHERLHTGERPYSCKTCGKSFAYAHSLTKHMVVHTGVKNLRCVLCPKRFALKHHLKQHLKTHARRGESLDISKILAAQSEKYEQIRVGDCLEEEIVVLETDQNVLQEIEVLNDFFIGNDN